MGASLEPTKLKLVDAVSDIARYLAISDDKFEIQDNTGTKVCGLEPENKSFGTESTVSVGAGVTSIIPKGIYYVCCGANTTVEYSPDGGTTWRTSVNAGGTNLVISDGSNVRLNNGGAAAEDSYLLPIN